MAKNKKKVRPHYVAKANRKKEPMSKNTKIGLLTGGGLLLLGLILFIALYNDGSLAVRDGVIVDKQDHWIISKLLTASSSKYFKLGEVLAPLEGYELDPEASVKSDANETSFTYVPVDPGSQIDSYSIIGVASTAQEMVETLPLQYMLYFPDSVFSEAKTVEVAGAQAHYLIALTPEEEEVADSEMEDAASEEADGETESAASDEAETPEEIAASEESDSAEEIVDDRIATQQMLCYVPSIRDSCILIGINLKITDDMLEWTEEALLDLVLSISEQVVIEKKAS